MNKVININISGMVFHIDEEAFEVLNRYLESLKRHFKNTDGGAEIMADIEARIAEMLTEILKNRAEVVSMANVQQVIQSMGQPEDMEEPISDSHDSYRNYKSNFDFNPGKKVYRDSDDRIFGGVCSGIANYLGIDAAWLRVAFVLFGFGFGISVLVYFVLWAILPVAETPSEKLEMRGEKINISNIEKTVKENLDIIKDRIDHEFKQFDKKDFKNKTRNFFEGMAEGLVSGMGGAFFVFARIFSFFIISICICAIVVVVFMILAALGILSVTVPAFAYDFFDSHQQSALVITLFAAILVIPFLGMFTRSVRYLAGYKRRNRAISGIFGSLWFICFAILAIIIFGKFADFRKSDTLTNLDHLKKPAHDTLYLAINDNAHGMDNYYEQGEIELSDIWSHIKSPGAKNMYGMVNLDIVRSTNSSINLEKQYYSRGRTYKEAQEFTRNMQYSYFQNDSMLTFDQGFKLGPEAVWRGQNLDLTLEIPDGTVIVMNKGLENIIYDISNTSNTYDDDMIGHKWKMTPSGLTCLDCPNEDDNHNHKHRHRHRFNFHRDFETN